MNFLPLWAASLCTFRYYFRVTDRSERVITASAFLMSLMRFRTRRIDVYKDILLGQMASSEKAEVWLPWKQEQYITMVEKSNCTAKRWIF